MPRPANPDHPIYNGLTARERTALMRDYAIACTEERDLEPSMRYVTRTGPAIFAATWRALYRAHQGKRRRARWPDEAHPPETAAEIRARKRAASLRKASAA